MRKFLIAFAFVLIGIVSNSQSRTEHYVLPDFNEGILLMKSGERSKGLVNYNALTEEIIIKQNGRLTPLSESMASSADTLYVKNRKFVNRYGKFMEVLLNSETTLYVEYFCVLKSNTQDRNAYGSSSQTSTTVVVSQVRNQGVLYNLELPELYVAELKYRYHFSKDNKDLTFETLRDIKKLYGNRKKDYNSYKKSNKANIKNPSTITGLIKDLEGLR